MAEAVSEQTSLMRKSYQDNGYVIGKQVFSDDLLSGLRQSLKSVLDKSPQNGADPQSSLDEIILRREVQDHNLVYRAAQSVGSSAATYRLLGSSDIFNIVSDLTGFKAADLHVLPLYLVIQLPSDDRFDYTWHQDGSYYPWCQDFLTLWFPVNRSAEKNTGTISIIPGSHRNGPRGTDTFLKHGFFKQMQSQLQAGEEEREEVLEVQTGDCCIMQGNAVHRSVANRSASPRVAGVLRIANLGTQPSYDREKFYCVHKS